MIGFAVMPDRVRSLGDPQVSQLMTRFKWSGGESIREQRRARIPTRSSLGLVLFTHEGTLHLLGALASNTTTFNALTPGRFGLTIRA